MNEPKEITVFQTIAIVINSTIGISVLALPRIASEKVGAGAFIVTLIAAIISILTMWMIASLSKRFGRKSIIEFGGLLITKPLGKLFGFLLICLFTIITSLVLREFGEVMSTVLLRETPIYAILISFLLLVTVSTRNTIQTISYIQTYYLPFIVIPIFLLVLFALQDLESRNLKPFLGNDTTFLNFLDGGISVAGLPFIQIGIYSIVITAPYMKVPSKIVKASLWGGVLSNLMILMAVGITVAVFGSEEIDKSLWPMLILTRMTELPAALLERMDIVFLVVWVISAFTTILSGYLICMELSKHLFNLRSHRAGSYVAFPLFLGLSLYPKNIFHLYRLIEIIGKWGLILTIGYPLLLLLISIIRKKGGTSKDEENCPVVH